MSGTIAGPTGEIPVTGTMTGNALKMDMNIQTPQGDMEITFTGDLGPTGTCGQGQHDDGRHDLVGDAREVVRDVRSADLQVRDVLARRSADLQVRDLEVLLKRAAIPVLLLLGCSSPPSM